MLADFPVQYRKSYPDKKTAKVFKERLENKLGNFEPEDIIFGYENCVEETPKYLPAIPDLISHIKEIAKARVKRLEGNAEAERIATLPKPTIQCNPMDMLKKANEAAKGGDKSDLEVWLKKKEVARLENIKTVGAVSKKYASHIHLCGVNGCNRSGSLASSTAGGENWYCSNHFRMVA